MDTIQYCKLSINEVFVITSHPDVKVVYLIIPIALPDPVASSTIPVLSAPNEWPCLDRANKLLAISESSMSIFPS